MLSFDDFKKIGLEDKPIFDSHTLNFPVSHSGELFSTMVSWGEYVEYRYASLEKSLIIMSKDNDGTIVHAPSGKFDLNLYKKILAFVKEENTILGFIKTPEKHLISEHFPKVLFDEDRDFFDYVYRAAELAELPGTKYAKIRNRLNKFKKNNTYTVEEITESNMYEINDFLKRWCLWKDCASDELLENERKAIVYSMNHFYDLGLSGLALRLKGAVEAIAVYEKMNADTVVVHFEKGSPDYDGIYKAINMETAQRVRHQVSFIDREEDLGISGLRQAKLGYKPDHFVELYHVKKESLRITTP